MTSQIEFMYNTNNNGTVIVPCGALDLTGKCDDTLEPYRPPWIDVHVFALPEKFYMAVT